MNRNLFLGIILSGMPFTTHAQQDTIADQRLQEVVVMAKLPAVEMSSGATTYRIDSIVTSGGGTLYDVLSSLPGVSINADGGISLNGKNGVKVLMDGKPTYLSGSELLTLLQSIPATNADKIDLITQPSARYDAAGDIGLLDIRTRKIKLHGINFSLSGSGSLGRTGNGYMSASMNLRRDLFNFFLTASHYRNKQIIDLSIDRPYQNDTYRMEQESYRRRRQRSNFLYTGCDLYLDPRTTLGIAFRGNFWKQKEKGRMLNTVSAIALSALSLSSEGNDWSDFTTGVHFARRLAPEGGELSASADYFYYDRRRSQHVQSVEADTLKGDMDGRIHIYAAQADLDYPVGKNWKLHAGLKAAIVRVDNRAGYMRPIANAWQTDGSLGSRFAYDENISAAYLQAHYEVRRLQFSAGLRLEHTHVRGALSGNTLQPDSAFTVTYLNLFPTASVQYTIAGGTAVGLSYGRRIMRPNYGDLNPFVYIFDPYTSEGGNTRLRPSFTDNLELTCLHGGNLQAILFFSGTTDAIVKNYRVQADDAIFVTPENFATCYQTGVRLHATALSPAPWWSLNLALVGIYNHYSWHQNDGGARVKNSLFTPILGTTNRFALALTWSAELVANYQGRMVYGQAIVHPMLEVNLGLRKTILKGQGSVTLFVKDLLNTKHENIDMPVNGGLARTRSDFKLRVLGISFSWYLKKGIDTKEKTLKTGTDEMKRVNL